MKIQIVSFHCTLKNKLGQVISTSFNSDVLTGVQNENLQLAALSKALTDLKPGEKRKINLHAAEAYGYYDPKMVVTMPRKSLPQLKQKKVKKDFVTLKVNGRPRSFRITEINSQQVTLDGNHPLAGQDLIFEIEAVAARDATAEEILDADPHGTNTLYH